MGLRDKFNRMLEDLQQRHLTDTATKGCLGDIPTDELRAIRLEAVRTLGNYRGGCDLVAVAGVIYVGFYETKNDAHLPPYRRRVTVVARGRTLAAIREQLRLWRNEQS